MPRLPDATAFGQRPTPQPVLSTARIGTGDNEALFMESQQTLREGALLGHTADVIHARNEADRKEFERKAKIEQDRIDNIRAEEAFTALREKQLDLTMGDNGFAKIKGTAVLSKPLLKDYGGKFGEHVKQIEGTLGTEEQRQRFRARAGVAEIQFREDMLRHIAAEGKAAEKQQFEGMVGVESRAAVANWDKPGAVALSLERMRAGIDRLAESNNWDPEFTKARKMELASKVHDAVIDQAIASGNLTYAQDWYKQHKGEIDPNTAKALQAKVVDADQRQRYNGYQTGYLSVQDSIPGLKALQDAVTKDAGLSDERKNILIGRIQNQTASLMRRQEALAERADRRAETELNGLLARIGRGYEPPAEDLGRLADMARGRPQVQQLLREVITTANVTRNFRNAHPMVQEQTLTQAEVGVREGRVDPKLLTTLRGVYAAQAEERKKDPVTYAVRQGISSADDPSGNDLAGKPIDWSRPDQMDPNQLIARMDLTRYMARNYGAPVKPMTVEEQALATSTLAQLDATGRRAYFQAIASNPAVQRDPSAYRAILAQIAPDNPVVANAGILAQKRVADPKHGDVAMLILQGQDLLNPNRKTDGKPGGGLINMPAEREFQKGWDDKVRNAYATNPEAGNAAYQTAKAIYASMSLKAGDSDKSVFDSGRWGDAVRMATGGTVRINASTFVKPHGMTEGEFADQFDLRLRALVQSGRLQPTMTMSKLRDMGIRNYRGGQYVLMVGDSVLADKEGRDVVIDFESPLPAIEGTAVRPGQIPKPKVPSTAMPRHWSEAK